MTSLVPGRPTEQLKDTTSEEFSSPIPPADPEGISSDDDRTVRADLHSFGVTARIRARGSAVLASPTINRGTAFTLKEREALGLTGLLPTGVSTLEGQLRRVYAQNTEQSNDLRKWVHLANLRDRNEVLFYRLLTEHGSPNHGRKGWKCPTGPTSNGGGDGLWQCSGVLDHFRSVEDR